MYSDYTRSSYWYDPGPEKESEDPEIAAIRRGLKEAQREFRAIQRKLTDLGVVQIPKVHRFTREEHFKAKSEVHGRPVFVTALQDREFNTILDEVIRSRQTKPPPAPEPYHEPVQLTLDLRDMVIFAWNPADDDAGDNINF